LVDVAVPCAPVRKALVLVAVLALAAAGWWVYRNASIERLRAQYRPWMERLGRWRDANEAVRRALRGREATPADPEGIAARGTWAWDGLDRLGYVDYRVEKPTHELGPVEKTQGRVTFTVGGFRADGARVERAAAAIVTFEGGKSSVRFDR